MSTNISTNSTTKNFEFKPVKTRLKTDLVLHPTCAEVLDKYTQVHVHTCLQTFPLTVPQKT